MGWGFLVDRIPFQRARGRAKSVGWPVVQGDVGAVGESEGATSTLVEEMRDRRL